MNDLQAAAKKLRSLRDLVDYIVDEYDTGRFGWFLWWDQNWESLEEFDRQLTRDLNSGLLL